MCACDCRIFDIKLTMESKKNEKSDSLGERVV